MKTKVGDLRNQVAELTNKHPSWGAADLAGALKCSSDRVRRALGWLQKNRADKVPQFDPSNPMVRSDVLQMLRRKKSGIASEDIAGKLCTAVDNVKAVISHLTHHDGYNITPGPGGVYCLSEVLPPVEPLNIKVLRGREIRFGLLSDTHICNDHERLDVLEAAYDMYAKLGITQVYHAGNIIDGEFKFNRYELKAHGVQDQCNYLADHYPQRSGIKTYFISAECYDDQTEVMTRDRGFIPFSELTLDQEIATLDLTTQKWVWQKPTEIIRKPFEGELLRFKSQKFDFMVTPGHRMIYKKRYSSDAYTSCRADEFPVPGDKQFFRGCSWEGNLPSTISISGPDGNNTEFSAVPFMKLLGWYIAEGYVNDTGTQIRIGQNPGSNREEIISIVQQLGFQYRMSGIEVCFSSPHLSMYLRKLGHSYQKYIPEEIKQLSSVLLEELLCAYWKGDGHDYGGSEAYASTSSRKLACDLVEIAMKCGWAATFSIRNEIGVRKLISGVETQSNYPEHCVYLAKNTMPWFSGGPEKISYKGEVFCATVLNETMLVKRGSKVMWGSNCHEGWWQKDTGLRIGWYIQNWCEEKGRKDLIHIGHLEQDVVFQAEYGSFRMRIMHPGDGTPYAISYPSQKMVESFQGGEKPQVLVLGHYHKFDMSYPREVLTIMPGCVEDQTPFMRKKKIGAHVGFCICTLGVRQDGTLGRFGCEWVPFYDRAYHLRLNGYPAQE